MQPPLHFHCATTQQVFNSSFSSLHLNRTVTTIQVRHKETPNCTEDFFMPTTASAMNKVIPSFKS